MKYLLVFTLFFSAFKAYSQNGFDLKALVHGRWKETCNYLQVKSDSFFYADRIDTTTISCVVESLSNLGVYKQLDTTLIKSKTDSIIFSQNEIDFIKKSLVASMDFSWPENLFSNSYRLTRNQIDDFIKKVDASSLSFEEKFCKKVFAFSQPFFLRQKTLCIVTIEEDNIMKAEGGTWVYLKEGGSWIKYAPLCLTGKGGYGYRK